MNFVGPGDFYFVGGDLPQIAIGNDIIPSRSGNAKRVLRGMDIAFLMEAIEERRRAIGLTPQSWTFSRVISAAQLNTVKSGIEELYASQRFVKELTPNAQYPIGTSGIDDKFRKDICYSSSDLSLPTITSALEMSVIEAFFSAVGNLNTYTTATLSSRDASEASEFMTTIYDAHSKPAYFTQDDLISYITSYGKIDSIIGERQVTRSGYDTYGIMSLSGKFFSENASELLSFASASSIRYRVFVDYTSDVVQVPQSFFIRNVDIGLDEEIVGARVSADFISAMNAAGYATGYDASRTGEVFTHSPFLAIGILTLRDRTRWT